MSSGRRKRTLEIHCLNCGAKFTAYYGYDENVETVEVAECGICAGEAHKKDIFKRCRIRLIPEVVTRGVDS
ncbi:MAG: hypothetical protein ACLQAT_02185 [Candidatus Binataceae bacterium]